MRRVVFLDSGPLGQITNPALARNTKRWLDFAKKQEVELRVAEITDYELRRNFILEGLRQSICNLNKYKQTKRFVPLTSEAIARACEMWAWAHGSGQPTSAQENIDADVILVAQALCYQGDFGRKFDQKIILTENLKHIRTFSGFGISVWDWKIALNDSIYDTITLDEGSSLAP